MLVQYAACLVMLGLLCGFAFWFRGRLAKAAPLQELRQTLELVPSLRCALRRSPVEPWTLVDRFEHNGLVLQSGVRLRASDVRDVVLAYRDGEVFAAHGTAHPLPNGFRYADTSTEDGQRILSDQHAVEIDSPVAVTFGPLRETVLKGPVYATTLTNQLAQPIRVRKFAAFVKGVSGWELSTITDAYFTGAQFVAWYGVPESGWVPPGTAVTDHFNYGGPRCLWLYEFETADGIIGVSAAVRQ